MLLCTSLSLSLTLWLSQRDGWAGIRGVTNTILVDGAHPEAVLLAFFQVKHREPGGVHHHIHTGQLPAVLPCQGLHGWQADNISKTSSVI